MKLLFTVLSDKRVTRRRKEEKGKEEFVHATDPQVNNLQSFS